MAFAWAIFVISAVPAALTLLAQYPAEQAALLQRLLSLPGEAGVQLNLAHQWYRKAVPPVEENRTLAPLPTAWQGHWYDADRNYTNYERWFADHQVLRDLMIRSKNELDYQLFHSSSRVYYGKHGELYGRNLADNELPATEHLLDTQAKRDRVEQGVRRFARQLAEQGVTMLLIAPIQKQYFTRERLPFFAPRVSDQSNFIELYQRLLAAPEMHMIDVRALLRAHQARFPIFYRQDFHWTDLMAHTVAAATTERIAQLEGSPLRWRHPLAWEMRPFVGAEARFASRLNMEEEDFEPALRQSWTARHRQDAYDAKASGLEFVTDTLDDATLLPPTCMYGNSFSDGMLRAGLTDHYRQFIKLDRGMPLTAVPAIIRGRCRYLIVQVLDLQTDRWSSLAD